MSRFAITGIGEFKYMLGMMPVYSPKMSAEEVGRFDTIKEAADFYDKEKVKPYLDTAEVRDENYVVTGEVIEVTRFFRKGGPLENYQPLMEKLFIHPDELGCGLHEIVVRIDDVKKGKPIPPDPVTAPLVTVKPAVANETVPMKNNVSPIKSKLRKK